MKIFTLFWHDCNANTGKPVYTASRESDAVRKAKRLVSGGGCVFLVEGTDEGGIKHYPPQTARRFFR